MITEDNPYMEILIPQHDLEFDIENLTQRELQACYENELDKADIVIVILVQQIKGMYAFKQMVLNNI